MKFSDRWSLHGEQGLYKDKIISRKSSAYQHIIVTQSKDNILSLYINGHLQLSSFDEHIYHENLVHPAMHLSYNKNILILGGGDGMALREVLKYKAINKIKLCDLDPEIIRLFQTNEQLVKLNKGSLLSEKIKFRFFQKKIKKYPLLSLYKIRKEYLLLLESIKEKL